MARTRTRTTDKSDEKARKATPHQAEAEENGSSRKDRPTPSARAGKPRGTGSTGLINRIPVVRGIVAYFRGVSAEMQKVTWPNREETTRLTGVVLGVTIAFALSLGALDAFYTWWFQQAFHADSEWIFLVVGGAVAAVSSGAFVLLRRRI